MKHRDHSLSAIVTPTKKEREKHEHQAAVKREDQRRMDNYMRNLGTVG